MSTTSSKGKNSSLTVKYPISRDYSIDKLSEWLNSLDGISEESLDSFSNSELKLIILSARDRERSWKCSRKEEIDSIHSTMATLADNMVKFSSKVEESFSVMADNYSNYKSYVTSASEKEDTSSELRRILEENEVDRKVSSDEERDRKSRENNLMVYGISENVNLSDCSNEFLSIAEELNLKPKIVDIYRVGKSRNDDLPRPLKIKLDSSYIRRKIVANAHKLKNQSRYRKIFLKPDLTVKERAVQKELWQKLKDRISSQPDKKWARKGDSIVEVIDNRE